MNIYGRINIPYLYQCAYKSLTPTKRCPRPGANAELIGLVLEYMKTGYKTLARSEIMDSHGAQKDILAGKVDTSIGKYLITEARRKKFDFSYPIDQMKPIFIVARREQNVLENGLLPFQNFSAELWLLFFTIYISLTLFIYAIRKMDTTKMGKDEKLIKYMRNGLLKGFQSWRETTKSGEIVALMLGIITLLVTGLYGNALLTVLLHPHQLPPFKGYQEMLEMVEKGKMTVLLKSEKNWFLEEIQHSNEPYFRQFREALKSNPFKTEPSLTKLLAKLETGSYIYPAMESIRTKYLLNKHCKLTSVTGDGLPTYWVAFIFRKNNTILPKFNYALLRILERTGGLAKKYSSEIGVECDKEVELSCWHRLKLETVYGVFGVLFIGMVSATVCFLMEYIQQRRRKTAVQEIRRTKERPFKTANSQRKERKYNIKIKWNKIKGLFCLK